jgi:nuclear transport factor 2 (NTF2) superfamily protein
MRCEETTRMSRPPLPPFTAESAALKARMAEDAWNSKDPARVALAYTEDSRWRNRSDFFQGRDAIVAFLTRKWRREQEYRLIKEVWAFTGDRIAVRFAYEYHDVDGNWYRAHGNEQWEFDEQGLMRRREASINDVPLREEARLFRWASGPRPKEHAGLSELGL